MTADYYSVWSGDLMLADHMSLPDALVFVKALFEAYYLNPSATFTIRKTMVNENEENPNS